MSPEATWPDDVFSSAEIEEMQYRFDQVAQEYGGKGEPIKVELTFTLDKARQFIAAVQRAPYHPYYASQVLQFAQYLASIVDHKIGEQ